MISAMRSKGSRVTIEFEPTATAERIAGRLIYEHGASVPFTGWIGLASGLERILTASLEPDAAEAECREMLRCPGEGPTSRTSTCTQKITEPP